MKTNNISDALKLILFGVSVLITCMIIKIIFLTSDEAKELSSAAIRQMEEMNLELMDSGLMKYDDTEIYGSDVMNCIRKYLGDYELSERATLYVHVKTTKSDNTYYNNTYITNMKNFMTDKYIKPTAIFTGKVIRDINDVIIGIQFIQR